MSFYFIFILHQTERELSQLTILGGMLLVKIVFFVLGGLQKRQQRQSVRIQSLGKKLTLNFRKSNLSGY